MKNTFTDREKAIIARATAVGGALMMGYLKDLDLLSHPETVETLRNVLHGEATSEAFTPYLTTDLEVLF